MGSTVTSLYDILKARKTGLSPDLYTLLRAQHEMPERVITAEPPIYFKSDGTAISEYQINGDTVQSGTPTPENPVEVLGVGDKTGDLLSYDCKIPITLNGEIQNIYLDESLYEGDYIKLNTDGSGVEHRAYGVYRINGTEAITFNGAYNLFTITSRDLDVKLWYIPLCSHLSSTGDVRIGGSNNVFQIWIFDNAARWSGDVGEFKEWLKSQYEAGTPVTIWYVLETPTTEEITLPQLTSIKGINELNIDTQVTPEVTLKGKIKQLPDSDMNALLSVMEEM